MDFVTARNLIIESSMMSRFYTSFLRCLHLVLSDPKGALSGHGLWPICKCFSYMA